MTYSTISLTPSRRHAPLKSPTFALAPELLDKVPRFTERDAATMRQIRERITALSACLTPREHDTITYLLHWRNYRAADHAKACRLYESTNYEIQREDAYDAAVDAYHAVASWTRSLLDALTRLERLHAGEMEAA